MSDQVEAVVHRVPRWVKIVLVLSLALNLLVVGLAAGTFWRVSKWSDRAGPPTGFAFVGALERQDRKAVLSDMREQHRASHGNRRELMQQVMAALRAETFDVEAVNLLVTQEAERGALLRTEVQNKVLEKIAGMDRDARLAYADRLEDRLRRGSNRKGRKN